MNEETKQVVTQIIIKMSNGSEILIDDISEINVKTESHVMVQDGNAGIPFRLDGLACSFKTTAPDICAASLHDGLRLTGENYGKWKHHVGQFLEPVDFNPPPHSSEIEADYEAVKDVGVSQWMALTGEDYTNATPSVDV